MSREIEQEIYNLHESGMTYREIGEKYGISVERARQLRTRCARYKDNELYHWLAEHFTDDKFVGTVNSKAARRDVRTVSGLRSLLKDDKVLGPWTSETLRKAIKTEQENQPC